MAIALTKAEAEMLIKMLKKYLEANFFDFPESKGKIAFDVIGERRTDEFVVNIDRKGINAEGCTYQGRIKSNNTILMRLDVNPTAIHGNNDGTKICGTHLHIYIDDRGIEEAIPFDVEDKDLYDTCLRFFELFNIVTPPQIKYQRTLF